MMLAEAKVVTEAMFAVAADILAACVSEDDLSHGALYPRVFW